MIRPLLKLFYCIAKNPKNIQRHLNTFQYQRGVLSASRIKFIPPIFAIAITENCNLRCPTCLYLLENYKFSPVFISLDRFRFILEKYNAKKTEVIFLSGGEPLLHPQFDELVDISKEYNVVVRTSTNGILVKENISALSKMDYVNVSVDGYDYESFKKCRGGTAEQFERIKEGLRILKKENVRFSISFLLCTENLSYKIIEFAEDFKPYSIYLHNINPHNSIYKPLSFQDKNTRAFLKKLITRTDYPFNIAVSTIFDAASLLNSKCIQPWYYFCVNSLGDVSFCCHLAHNQDIGNTADYDFNSKAMVEFREYIRAEGIKKSCLYCQRRFMNDEFGRFNAKARKWIINEGI